MSRRDLLEWSAELDAVYADREQTWVKHFILERYLGALASKVLRGGFPSLTYVDGFSGPWKSRDPDFADTSFMIAIRLLKDIQRQIAGEGRRAPEINCIFCENDPEVYPLLKEAVVPFHDPASGFRVVTRQGDFEDAVAEIDELIGRSFPLVFIDPTGWTGYPLAKIRPLFDRAKCEVIINFMYDHINRFIETGDPSIAASFDPIMGGPGWQDKLDLSQGREKAVLEFFRERIEMELGFKFVVSTKIDKSTAKRPHFFLVYGTKSEHGLKEFRETEWKALREHEGNVSSARRRKTAIAGQAALFEEDDLQDDLKYGVADLLREEIDKVRDALPDTLRRCGGSAKFKQVWQAALKAHMLRQTNVKDICCQLAREGVIDNTWSTAGRRKPGDDDLILLRG